MVTNYTYYITLAFSFLIILLTYVRKVNLRKLIIFLSCLFFFTYCFFQGFILHTDRGTFAIEIYVLWVIPVFASLLAFQERNVQRKFCRMLILIMAFFVLSYVISFALSLVVGWDKLKLFEIDYSYFVNAPVFFPFTIAYGHGTIAGIDIWRLLGIGRESGITQTIYMWGFFVADDYFNKANIIKILMVLGLVVCFSTTGMVIFVGIQVLNLLMQRWKKLFSFNTLAITIVIVMFVYLLVAGDTFSFSYRFEMSYSDRIDAMEYAMTNLVKSPFFGVGFMRTPNVSTIQSDISLIASTGQIGLIGILLFLLVYLVALLNTKDKQARKKFMFSNSGFLLTTLFAQPLFYSGLIYYFLLMDYSINQNKHIQSKNELTDSQHI